jgi:hypothetical protein
MGWRRGLLGLSLVAAAWPDPALACSAIDCVQGYLYPGDGATIPANAGALLWRPQGPRAVETVTSTATRLRREDTQAEVGFTTAPLDGALVLTPDAPLSPGAYVFEDGGACAHSAFPAPQPVRFVVGSAAPTPTTLGTLVPGALDQIQQMVAAGAACSELVPAAVMDVRLTLSAEAQPWSALLLYRTVVDGQPWRPNDSLPRVVPTGASWMGRGVDRLYAACGPTQLGSGVNGGLSEGPHSVVMQATLPGTNLLLETPPVQVTLTCVGVDENLNPAEGGCRCVTPGASGAGLSGVLLLGLGLGRRRLRGRVARA